MSIVVAQVFVAVFPQFVLRYNEKINILEIKLHFCVQKKFCSYNGFLNIAMCHHIETI